LSSSEFFFSKGAAGLPALVSSIDSASFSFYSLVHILSCILYGICSSFRLAHTLAASAVPAATLLVTSATPSAVFCTASAVPAATLLVTSATPSTVFCTHVRSYSKWLTPCAVFCTASNVPSATPFAVSNPPPTTASVAPSATLYGFSYTFSGLKTLTYSLCGPTFV